MSEDGMTLVFQPSSGQVAPLHKVPASGGTPAPFGQLANGETTQRWPQTLPRGKGVLYSRSSSGSDWDLGALMVQPLDGGYRS